MRVTTPGSKGMFPVFGSSVDRTVWRRRLGDKLRNCLNCLVGLLVLLVIFGSLGAYGLAKTGLVTIPGFSRFYTAPEPERVVLPAAQSFTQVLAAELSAQVLAASGDPLPDTISLTLDEAVLTRGLQDALTGWSQNGITISEAQVMITESGAMFYGKLALRDVVTPVQFTLVPALSEKPIPVKITRASVGELRMWARLVNFVVGSAVRTQLDRTGAVFPELPIEAIDLGAGELTVTIELREALLPLLQ
jgi:hypothetical protein